MAGIGGTKNCDGGDSGGKCAILVDQLGESHLTELEGSVNLVINGGLSPIKLLGIGLLEQVKDALFGNSLSSRV